MRFLVPIASFFATWIFFYEYLPPFKSVHFYADIEGYHYPLLNYAHRAVRNGNLPQWDSSIYSGVTFVGNTQVGLFYPPNWLVFWVNRHRDGVKFFTVEALLVLHAWIAFVCCWMWLRGRARGELPAILGAAVFAFGGFFLGESQHLGANCAYAWFPLALLGVDQFAADGNWRRLGKVTLASALMFLAGYPYFWVGFCCILVAYAAAVLPWKRIGHVLAALAYSVLLFLVQLVPSLEASSLKLHEMVYANGVGGWQLFLAFFLPNRFDQSHRTPATLVEEQYLYLGAIAMVALVALLRRGTWQQWKLPLWILTFALILVNNPGRIIEMIVTRLPMVWEVLREWSFLPAFPIAAALVTMEGVHRLRQSTPIARAIVPAAAAVAALVWCTRLLWLWKDDGVGFASGWATAIEMLITACLLYVLLRAGSRWWATAALLVLVFVEYKAYGTSRRFSSANGDADQFWGKDRRVGEKEFSGVLLSVYEEMRNNPDCRIALLTDQHSTDMRHYGLNTPQGFDPFLPHRYREYVERFVPFETNRTFLVDYTKTAMLDAFAVRYLIVPSNSDKVKVLDADPRLRLMSRDPAFFFVYEYQSAQPNIRFAPGELQRVSWTPERRVVRVNSDTGGELRFLEQAYPGWRAFVDGEPVPIRLHETVFQAITVPPGRHSVEFRFRSPGLAWAGLVSLVSLGAFIYGIRRKSAH